MRQRLGAVVLALALLSAAGCARGDALTLEEYSALVCNVETYPAETWGGFAVSARGTLAAFEGIVPPVEMSSYHALFLAGMRGTRDLAESSPPNDEVVQGDLLAVPEVWAAAVLLGNLPVEVRETLRKAGCDIDAEEMPPLSGESAGLLVDRADATLAAASAAPVDEEPGLLRPLEDGGVPLEGVWYFNSVSGGVGVTRQVVSSAVGSAHQVVYECVEFVSGGQSFARVRVGYPDGLPEDLVLHGYAGSPGAWVDGNMVPLMWQWAQEDEDGVKLVDVEARALVQNVVAGGTDSYGVRFSGRVELNVVLPSSGLADALWEGQMACFGGDQGFLEERLAPPADLAVVDGWYRFESPGGEFVMRYPVDCGPLWESPTYFEAIGCRGYKSEIGTLVELYEVSDTAGTLADAIAMRFGEGQRYSLNTDDGLVLEVLEMSYDQGRGLSTNVVAAFVDGNGTAIVVDLIYWAESELPNRSRVEETLRSLRVGAP